MAFALIGALTVPCAIRCMLHDKLCAACCMLHRAAPQDHLNRRHHSLEVLVRAFRLLALLRLQRAADAARSVDSFFVLRLDAENQVGVRESARQLSQSLLGLQTSQWRMPTAWRENLDCGGGGGGGQGRASAAAGPGIADTAP